jgi:hypothetical protein
VADLYLFLLYSTQLSQLLAHATFILFLLPFGRPLPLFALKRHIFIHLLLNKRCRHFGLIFASFWPSLTSFYFAAQSRMQLLNMEMIYLNSQFLFALTLAEFSYFWSL